MRNSLKALVTLLTAVLALLIGLSDYFGWTDILFGRNRVIMGIERLSNTKGYPEIIIFEDEIEFRPLWKVIRSNTSDPVTLEKLKEGKVPSAIVRLGGTLSPPIGKDSQR